MFSLQEAQSHQDYRIGADLFQEYADHIGVDLEFQDFEQELKDIQNHYGRPEGALLLAFDNDGNPVGCSGIRKLSGSVCELKRMYVKQDVRGHGLGKLLLNQSIELAKDLNYHKIRLDTLPSMLAAFELYRKIGFKEIEPYRYNPIGGTRYMELDLRIGN